MKILLPSTTPRCQVDGKPIIPKAEPGRKLYLVQGAPMCAFHRLMRLGKGKIDYRKLFTHRRETEKAKLDRMVAEETRKQKENQRIREVAAESQEQAAETNTKL